MNRFGHCAAAWLLLGGIAVAQTPFPRSQSIDVIAHRGASAEAPENTLAAFARAITLGADWFELDCTLSKDDEIIVIHDDTVDRTTDGAGAVADLTLGELKDLDAGTWKDPKFAKESIPTLGEALELAKGKIGVYIEIKDSDDDTALKRAIRETLGPGPLAADREAEMIDLIEASGSRNLTLTRKVIETVRQHGMAHDVVIQSFSPICCAVALAEAQDLRTELLAEDDKAKPEQWEDAIWWDTFLNPPGFNPNIRAAKVRLEELNAMRAAGRTIAVWTVNGNRDMGALADWGASAIITNYPDVALNVLKEKGKR